MNTIDRFLNSITMYRLVLWSLRIMAAAAFVLTAFGLLSFNLLSLFYSLLILILVSYAANLLFARMFKVQSNYESYAITLLILFLVLAPPTTFFEAGVIALAAFIAMASKYIFAIHGRHIFNPAAIALLLIGLAGSGQASWWVGSAAMLPLTLIAGFLIIRKIRRFSLFISFFVVALGEIVILGMLHGLAFSSIFIQAFLSWPLVFFGTVMLTEPSTMPSTQNMQIMFGIIVGLLFGSQWSIGPIFATPELALVVGNVFAYIVSSRPKLRLRLKQKRQLSENIQEFSFSYDRADKKPFVFLPGQYMEWTLAHPKLDSRGNRRIFTIASSPTEKDIKLAMRFETQKPSSFKNALMNIEEGDELLAGSLAGNFILPKEKNVKLAFIAGGVGITPFRSMVKYFIDMKEKRDAVLFYVANAPDHFVYKELFIEAEAVGVKTKYAISIKENAPADWQGIKGFISKEIIARKAPDFLERIWFVSGPNAMVDACKDVLLSLGVSASRIKKDYFPGF
jgi:ferredoxin-NADP reductase